MNSLWPLWVYMIIWIQKGTRGDMSSSRTLSLGPWVLKGEASAPIQWHDRVFVSVCREFYAPQKPFQLSSATYPLERIRVEFHSSRSNILKSANPFFSSALSSSAYILDCWRVTRSFLNHLKIGLVLIRDVQRQQPCSSSASFCSRVHLRYSVQTQPHWAGPSHDSLKRTTRFGSGES